MLQEMLSSPVQDPRWQRRGSRWAKNTAGEFAVVQDSPVIPHSCSYHQQPIVKSLGCDRTTYGYCIGSVHAGLKMEMDSAHRLLSVLP